MDKSPKYFIIGLTLGLVNTSDVQLWVDEQIEASEEPNEELLDLAFIDKSNVKELLSKLSYIDDERDDFEILRILIAGIGNDRLANINFCSRLATELYVYYVEHDYKVPEDFREIGFFDDSYDLAKNGTYGTLESWHSDFKHFANSFSRNS
jgi:hypothetical protein